MNGLKLGGRSIGPLEAVALIGVGLVLALVVAGAIDGVALIILLVVGYFAHGAGRDRQAQRFRPVEPPRGHHHDRQPRADGAGHWRLRLVSGRRRRAPGPC